MPRRSGHSIEFALAALLVAGACSRSGLDGFRVTSGPGPVATIDEQPGFEDAAAAAPPDAPTEDSGSFDSPPPPPTSTTEPPTTVPVPPDPPDPPVPHCTPSEEVCNRVDDDCDGHVDEDLAPVPCPHGGERYCVAGRLSACPERCEACIPGSERVCFLSYCTFWATQTCTADGRSFGICREHGVPPECEDVASRYKDSAQLERCCIDKGYCCRDEFDLDGDGSRNDMLGACDEVACTP